MLSTIATVASVTFTLATAAFTAAAYVNLNFIHPPEVNPIDEIQIIPRSLNELGLYKTDSIKITDADRRCLAHNIYYEAGVEDYYGKIAVAQVTINRLKAKRWGNTICKVVYSPHQFSWTKQNKKSPKGPLWEASKQAADDFIDGTRIMGLSTSLYYHATWMETKPAWANHKIQVTEIGQHVFYTLK
jgi:N-acetylmuramoyl-L-alanine amidase